MRRTNYIIFFLVPLIACSLAIPYQAGAAKNPTAGGEPVISGGSTAVSGGEPAVSGGQLTQQYLSGLYKWFLAFVSIAALFAFVMGGTLYMFAGANIGSTGKAKEWIVNGLFGLLLAASSWLLLHTINPELVGGFDITTLIKNNVPPRRPVPAPSRPPNQLPPNVAPGRSGSVEG